MPVNNNAKYLVYILRFILFKEFLNVDNEEKVTILSVDSAV